MAPSGSLLPTFFKNLLPQSSLTHHAQKGYPKIKEVKAEFRFDHDFRLHVRPKVRGSHTHLLLEGLRFLRHQGICFANDGDDVDLLMHRPEEGHI